MAVGSVSVLLLGALLLDVGPAMAVDPPDVLWTHQFGTSTYDFSGGVAVDASGVYVAGGTDGELKGESSSGKRDGFVRRYDTLGNVVWTRQFGTSEADVAWGVAVDASGIYVAGTTLGVFPGLDSAGGEDGFIRKYDRLGNVVWTRQFGTDQGDAARAVAVYASGIYLAGVTGGVFPGEASAGGQDGFVVKYTADGNEAWARQFGTSEADIGWGLAADASGVLVTGDTEGAFSGQIDRALRDSFLLKYDNAGNRVWTRQFGTDGYDSSFGVATNGAGVFVTGATSGVFTGQTAAGGFWDGFVRRYDTAGNEVWTRQFGTNEKDSAGGVALDGGGVYLVGDTTQVLPDESIVGSADGFIKKYDTAGNEVWTSRFGTTSNDLGHGIAVDSSGIYLTGSTTGTFHGQVNTGSWDVYVVSYGASGPASCMGRRVTIQGTAASEVLEGTPGDDVIDARGGDDIVYGYGGDDVICGGGGDDSLHGGSGADLLVDAAGINVFDGGDDNDEIRAGGASSEVYAGAGDDIVRTWALVGYVDGGVGNDDLGGSYHPETFIGGDGHDTIRPHDGLNEVYAGSGNDDIWTQGAGRDQIIDGGPGNDLIRADQGNDILLGGDGDDIIYGRKGNDTIDGGAGDDKLWGHQGNDTIDGGDGNDVINGWGGKDSLSGGAGNDRLYGGGHNDAIVGGDGVDRVVGGFGDDVLYGGGDDDILNGRGGNDELHGGNGDDLIKGGPGSDRLWGDAGNDDLRGANGSDALYGGRGDDRLRGHAMGDLLHGQDGHDLLWGGLGDDTLDGGDGTDHLIGGGGTDTCFNGETYDSCELPL